jgi:hypothetical protein
MGRLVIGKFSNALAVWIPQYASMGICMDPTESLSVLVVGSDNACGVSDIVKSPSTVDDDNSIWRPEAGIASTVS